MFRDGIHVSDMQVTWLTGSPQPQHGDKAYQHIIHGSITPWDNMDTQAILSCSTVHKLRLEGDPLGSLGIFERLSIHMTRCKMHCNLHEHKIPAGQATLQRTLQRARCSTFMGGFSCFGFTFGAHFLIQTVHRRRSCRCGRHLPIPILPSNVSLAREN